MATREDSVAHMASRVDTLLRQFLVEAVHSATNLEHSAVPLAITMSLTLTAALLLIPSPNWRACIPWNSKRDPTHLAGAFLQSILLCYHTM